MDDMPQDPHLDNTYTLTRRCDDGDEVTMSITPAQALDFAAGRAITGFVEDNGSWR